MCWLLMPPRDSRKESMLSPLRSERKSSVVLFADLFVVVVFSSLSVRTEGE